MWEDVVDEREKQEPVPVVERLLPGHQRGSCNSCFREAAWEIHLDHLGVRLCRRCGDHLRSELGSRR